MSTQDEDTKAAGEWYRNNECCDADGDIRNYHLHSAFLAGAAHARRWISTRGRTPEFGDLIIARWEGGDCEILRCTEGERDENGCCYLRFVDNYGDVQCDEFTHWMPLPTGPKEGE